jgi:hypothetical protein
MEDKLCISKLDDWYDVSIEHIRHYGGFTLLKKVGGILPLLMKHYGHHPWKKELFSSYKSSQKLLYRIVKNILPNEVVLMDFIHPDLKYPDSNANMELDIYCPNIRLALEYNGEQHYGHSDLFGSDRFQWERDRHKQLACESQGISLIRVPYWWKFDKYRQLECTFICSY